MPLILIVDDNNESRYLLDVLLERNGFETVTATNGREALEIAHARRPDLIISDILMPVMDGFALCKEWMTDDELKRIPFVFYTATYTEPKDVEFGLSLGAVRFLIKPQEVEVLLQVFREVLSESGTETQVVPERSLEEEMEILRHHNEALFRKLEKKMADLEAANRSLQREVDKRHLTERSLRESERKLQTLLDTLQKAHDELEQRVAERTAELAQAYKRLEAEMAERAKVEEQRREAHKMEALGTLAAGIAHDFNNILASILGFTEMAVEDVSDRPDVEKSLRYVLKSTLRARDLVQQILAFSRKTSYARSPVSLSPLIKETVQLLRASIPATVEIVLNIAATSDTVLAAPVEVQQLVMNLGSNASLALQEGGGTIEISLNDIDVQPDSPMFGQDVAPGEYLQLVVKDTGIGMTADVMKRVFDPFFTTRSVGKGMGMGLAVVYGIVKSLNGTITVESEPGVGSTFRIFLPKVKAEVKAGPVKTTATGGHERILFVDDEELLTQLNDKRLKGLGYEVIATTSSREALDLFKAEPERFDLVITDYTMPHLTGIDLANQLLTIRGDIPIILCTGHNDAVSPEIAKEKGIRAFLMKPLSKQRMAEAIRRVLDSKAGA